MKGKCLLVNNAILFFGVSIYVGLLWALHFFWYPTWQYMTPAIVEHHFLMPVDNATAFFTIVLPIMFITNVLWMLREWRRPLTWYSLVTFLLIMSASGVGRFFIFPINDLIASGELTDSAELYPLFRDWMFYNDLRGLLMSASWLLMMAYFIRRIPD